MSIPLTSSYQGSASLGTAICVQIINPFNGSAIISRGNTGIREDVAHGGFYVWAGTVNTTLTAYEAVWDEGLGTPAYGEIIIPQTSAGTAILSSVSGGGLVSPLSFTIKRGDTDPSLVCQTLIPDPNDSTGRTIIPWPIPSGATVKFTMRDVNDFTNRTRTSFPAGAAKIHATASVDDATNGIVSYGWSGTADTDTDGVFRGEFEVTTLTGEVRTFPTGTTDATNWITITITDDLDPGVNP